MHVYQIGAALPANSSWTRCIIDTFEYVWATKIWKGWDEILKSQELGCKLLMVKYVTLCEIIFKRKGESKNYFWVK